MSSLNWILACVFDCIHRHTTWPRRDQMGLEYVCCVDCGRELPYSTERMSIVRKEEQLQLEDRSRGTGGTREYGMETSLVFADKTFRTQCAEMQRGGRASGRRTSI